MRNTASIAQTVLPVFLTLALGMLCRSRNFLSRDGIDALKKVVLNICLPFLLLDVFACTDYSLDALILPAIVFVLCCLALALGRLVARIFRLEGRLVPFLASGFEAGMLGYALFAFLFPDSSLSHFALLDLGQTLFVFTLFKILLSGKSGMNAVVQDMIRSPVLCAIVIGVLLGATGLYGAMGQWSAVMSSVTDFIASPTGTIILLTVGYDLVPRSIPWKRTFGLVAMRLGIMAAVYGILMLLNRAVLGGIVFEGAALLMVILPPPYVIPVFADEPAERVQISAALSAMTLVTMILFAILSVILGVQ